MVLAGQGSAVALFGRQVTQGGPVLEASRIGEGGEIYILDMGEPISISDLALHVIRLKGYEPNTDIPVVFTGPRPGEKMVEELWYPDELPSRTSHPKILKARANGRLTWHYIEGLLGSVDGRDRVVARSEVVRILSQLVPEYRPQGAEPQIGTDFHG